MNYVCFVAGMVIGWSLTVAALAWFKREKKTKYLYVRGVRK